LKTIPWFNVSSPIKSKFGNAEKKLRVNRVFRNIDLTISIKKSQQVYSQIGSTKENAYFKS